MHAPKTLTKTEGKGGGKKELLHKFGLGNKMGAHLWYKCQKKRGIRAKGVHAFLLPLKHLWLISTADIYDLRYVQMFLFFKEYFHRSILSECRNTKSKAEPKNQSQFIKNYSMLFLYMRLSEIRFCKEIFLFQMLLS